MPTRYMMAAAVCIKYNNIHWIHRPAKAGNAYVFTTPSSNGASRIRGGRTEANRRVIAGRSYCNILLQLQAMKLTTICTIVSIPRAIPIFVLTNPTTTGHLSTSGRMVPQRGGTSHGLLIVIGGETVGLVQCR